MLEDKIKKCEARLKNNFNFKYDYNCILSHKVELSLFRMRQKYYDSGDKAGKLLANSLKQRELSSIISAVRSEEGELKAKTVDINSMFRDFYVNLYTAEIQHSEEDIESFFKDLIFPDYPNHKRQTSIDL